MHHARTLLCTRPLPRARLQSRMRSGLGCLLILPVLASLLIPAGAAAQTNDDCLVCHGDVANFEGMENAARYAVDASNLAETVHGVQGMACVDCHADLSGMETHPGGTVERVDCGTCHSDEETVFDQSLHGYALSRGNPRAPTCAGCHTSHDIRRATDPRSSIQKDRLPETCAVCHGKQELLPDQYVKLPESFLDYTQSVHGQGVTHGVTAAASCSDCHEVHALKSSADPASPINPRNVSKTCGKCHPYIEVDYENSIHGRAMDAGVLDSPTCTDCHGEHLILSPTNPEAKTSLSHLAKQTCGKCHDDPVIVAKYNLESGVVGSYEDSYHGWAVRRGYDNAATCISCHTAHSVLPKADPASTVNQANGVETCRQCHERADVRFAASYTHTVASISKNPINRAIRGIYLALIFLIIGGMVAHNLLVMNYYMIENRKRDESSAWVMRFDRAQVVQHLALTISFIGLVVTGFALRFPDAMWVRWLMDVGLTEQLRGDLHRVLAVILVLTSFYHAWWIFGTSRGRDEFSAMLPRWRDFTDFFQNMRFHTWRAKDEVKFGRYDYSQKAEYWALIWGTIAMIVTGIILWFPAFLSRFLPWWGITAAQTIHYYEAWLASLAILVWHFFFVIFHPEEYPMSWTWLTGRMSERAVKKHHARWYEEEIAAPTQRRGAASGKGGDLSPGIFPPKKGPEGETPEDGTPKQ